MGVFLIMSWPNRLCDIAKCLIGNKYADKLIMIANILCHDWRIHNLFSSNQHTEFHMVSDRDIVAAFPDIDPESLACIRTYIRHQKDFLITQQNYGCFFFNYRKLYEKNAIREADLRSRQYKKILKRYKTPPNLFLGGEESFVAHHGLLLCPESVKSYICGGIFLDAGACFGDSTLVFLEHYHPCKVIAFEPSVQNRKIFESVMQLNHIQDERYELSPLCLGNECSVIDGADGGGADYSPMNANNGTIRVEITTLDNFCKKKTLSNIKLIKADVEGMGLDLLLGAKETIRRNRPVLSLSLYHNQKEMFGIYKALREWTLDYHFIVRNLTLFGETTLIAWPKELDLPGEKK